MPSHQHSHPKPQAPSVGLSQSSSTKRMSCRDEIDADRGERLQIEVLKVLRRRLHDHLELIVVLQAVGVFAVAAVLGPARRLHIGRVPRLRPERAQGGRGMEGAGAHLHVVGLQDHAALLGPEPLQSEDKALERTFRAHMVRQGIHRQIRSREGGARGTVSAGERGIKAKAARNWPCFPSWPGLTRPSTAWLPRGKRGGCPGRARA